MTTLAFASAIQLAARVRRGHTTAVDLLELFLERQARFHARLNAVVVTDLSRARKAAQAIDRARRRGAPLGPLAGVPVTVKESFDLAGLPTTWGVPAHRNNRAARDALVPQRLAAAGAVLWGKSNVPVLLADWQTHNPIYGTTNNPWDLSRTPGGSSGGGAAALAAGLTALEYGSDIGGSIRGPAHFCGVYGHKSTYGIVPTRGHALPDTFHPTDMSVIGPLARSAADLALALRLTAGPAGAEAHVYRFRLPAPAFRSLKGLRVAVVASDPVAEVDAAVTGAIEELVRFLAKAGARIARKPKLPVDPAAHAELYVLLRRAATSMRANDDASFARLLEQRATLDPADHRYPAEQVRGNTLHHREWLRLSNERHRLRRAWECFFQDHDVLLLPSAATTAFPQNTQGERWSRTIRVNDKPQPDTTQIYWMGHASVSGLPATVAPIAIAQDRLPTGVQIVGAPYADLSTIRFAELIEREYCAFQLPPGYD